MKPTINKGLVLIIVFLAFTMSGCISLTPPKHSEQAFKALTGAERQARLARIHRFAINGAFSIQQVGKKPMLANYFWQQEGKNQYRIRISSALNLFNITVLGRLHSVTLWKSAKDHVTARTPEALLQKEMGWSLPIRNMFYWVRGMAAPGAKHIRRNKYGLLVGLTQDGWKIQFSDYSKIKGFDLPSKLKMKHASLNVTLVMKHWRLLTSHH